MRLSIFVGATALVACVSGAHRLCASMVEGTWTPVTQPSKSAEFENELRRPQARTVRGVQHLWYRRGDADMLVCTIHREALDNCSIIVTGFTQADDHWFRAQENGMICISSASIGRRLTIRLERTRGSSSLNVEGNR